MDVRDVRSHFIIIWEFPTLFGITILKAIRLISAMRGDNSSRVVVGTGEHHTQAMEDNGQACLIAWLVTPVATYAHTADRHAKQQLTANTSSTACGLKRTAAYVCAL